MFGDVKGELKLWDFKEFFLSENPKRTQNGVWNDSRTRQKDHHGTRDTIKIDSRSA